MANISLISLNYSPEEIGIGPYSLGWAEYLAARGHHVHVVCGVPYYPDWRLHRGFSQEFSRTVERGVHVTRVPHHIPDVPSTSGRLRHYLTFARNAARALDAEKEARRPDMVVAIAPALLAAPVALRHARRHGALSWLHIQDFEIEAGFATGQLPRFVVGPVIQMERAIIRRFDRVSTISPRMAVKAVQQKGATSPVPELRNWAEPEVGSPAIDGHAMREELSLPDGVIALYSGTLAKKQGIGLIVDAARALRDEPTIQIVVCGAGPEARTLADAGADLPNLHIRPLQPRERLPALLAMGDIHLLPQLAGAADLVLPSKLANMLASGRPVVAASAPETSLTTEVEGCGLCTPPGDAPSFAGAIATLAHDPTRRRQLGQAASRRAARRWSKPALLAKLADAFENAMGERGE